MHIAIVDDVEFDRAALLQMTERYFAKAHVECGIHLFESARDFLRDFVPQRYQIVFMDIYMDGMTGMEAARELRKTDSQCRLVFTTTSVEHAVESYDVGASHYLLKPVAEDKLVSVLSACRSQLQHDERFIEITANRMPMRILLRKIVYAESERNTVCIHTTAGELRAYMPFCTFLSLIEGDPRFLQCYKGCVVNMDCISAASETDFIMHTGDRVPLRKKEAAQLKAAYLNYALTDACMNKF